MKRLFATIALLFLLAVSCTEEDYMNSRDPLKEHHMQVIPPRPTVTDIVKLVIADDCTYNLLAGVSRRGTTISIQKNFNSMMKWPCVQQNDTIVLGKFAAGTYLVNYTLFDTSPLVENGVVYSFSFDLKIYE